MPPIFIYIIAQDLGKVNYITEAIKFKIGCFCAKGFILLLYIHSAFGQCPTHRQ